ncbi:hypothetical protein BpHYR1_006899 [Brachionus plicatilis]|uniref:Uncharacterized protein n=1 Tax=Brachionus plicatilis TaxID=10195 RepID=A0A3M7PS14_BRAPC|nr:hypothetical protein BpHYR1_006899 [Brachionus plicatilis]
MANKEKKKRQNITIETKIEVLKAKDKTNKSDFELADIFKIDRNINILLVVIFCHLLVLSPLDTRDIWGDI